MDGITFFFRLIVNTFLLLLAQADSILFSSPLINHHFSQSQSYIYTAAFLDNPQANYQLYIKTKNKHWLKEAAGLNHLESVFQWYLLQHDNQHISQYVWLKQAINLGHKEAILIQLSHFIENKDWVSAKEFQHQHLDVLNTLENELNVKYQNIDSLLSVAALSDKNTSALFSGQIPTVNLTSKVSVAKPKSQAQIQTQLQCAITIQAVVESAPLLSKAKQFKHAFAKSKFNDLSICFLTPQIMPELQVVCEPDKYSRIECNLNQLAQSLLKKVNVNPITYNHLLVIVEQGDANTRGGLMYLDKQDSDQVFIHELAHWLGYVDEYQIKPEQQKQLCNVIKPKWISPNLFVTSKKINKSQAQKIAGHSLYPANTCNGSNFQAYKKYKQPSFMEFLHLPLSGQYVQDIKQSVDYSSILPVAMNFWVNYSTEESVSNRNDLENQTEKQFMREQFMREQYLTWVKIAAAQNYTPAMTLLAQEYITSSAYTDAYTLLLQSAEMGNANAQLLLGHGYIEGRWLPQDVIKSAYWYEKAALQNDPYGLYFYAKCHEMGWGCELSLKKALTYYKRAKKLGNKLAINRLKYLSVDISN